jgi:flagellar biosynthesis protein FliQ
VNEAVALDWMRETVLTALTLAAPALAVGLLVGVTVAILQAVTSVQEQTLSLVPKLFAVVGVLILVAPWILATLGEFTRRAFEAMAGQGG